MAKKKKNRKQHKSNISLQQVINSCNNNNFLHASKQLKLAKIKSEEAGLAKQIKVEINNRIAFEHFKNNDFDNAIKTISSCFAIQPRDNFPLPVEKSYILTGLSNLYLGKFNDASKNFSQVLKYPDTKGFAFYYLLSLIYENSGNFKNFDLFYETHIDLFKKITSEKRTYTEIAFHIVTRNFNEALTILNDFNGKTIFVKKNIEAIKNIISEQKHSEEKPLKLKALYKTILNFDVKDEEIDYLKYHETFDDYFYFRKKNLEITSKQHILEQLCLHGKILPEKEFENLLNNTDDELKSQVIYNQIANIYNNKINVRTGLKLASKYYKLFFKIPESLDLYINLVNYTFDDSYPYAATFRNINYYVDNFKNYFQEKQLNDLGWMIFDNVDIFDPFSIDITLPLLIEFLRAHPKVIAIKLWIFILFVIDKRTTTEKSLLDLFSIDAVQNYDKRVVSEVDYFLNLLYPDEDDFFFYSVEDDIKDYIFLLNRFIDNFSHATQNFKINKKTTVILDILYVLDSIITKFRVEFSEDEGAKISNLEKKFKKLKDYNFEFFGENIKSTLWNERPYHIKTKTENVEQFSFLKKTNSPTAITEFIKKVIAEGNKTELLNYILNSIHFSPLKYQNINNLISFIKTIGDTEPVTSETFQNIKKSLINLSKISSKAFTKFIISFLQKFSENLSKKADKKLFLFLAEPFPMYITKNSDSTNLDIVGKILFYTQSFLEKNPNFNYNSNSIKIFLDYAHDKHKDKKAKDLRAIYFRAKSFFGKLFNSSN